MPTLTRFYIKTAFAYLMLALALGALSGIGRFTSVSVVMPALQPVAYHFFVLGWATQMIFGVAWWMFPRLSRQNPRGSERVAWLVYWLLNAGLILRAVAEPIQSVRSGFIPGLILFVSAVFQMTAVWIYAISIWPRIQPPRPQQRVATER